MSTVYNYTNTKYLKIMELRNNYLKPTIKSYDINIECSIANHSASALAMDEEYKIYENWIEDQNVESTIDW